MRFGFHISISRGFPAAIEEAKSIGCETMQIFTGSQQQWKRSRIDPAIAEEFRTRKKKEDITPLVVHLFYLPNLATNDGELFEKSRNALCIELERSALLGADLLVLHPGAYKSGIKDQALRHVASALDYAIGKTAGTNADKVKILIENTSGGGTRLGAEFEELARMFDLIRQTYKVGICLDTSHAFEAGYPLHTAEGLEDTLAEFNRLIGLDKLLLLHLNDSKTPFGSRQDRHWHIGEGEIGLEAFKRIINHSHLRHLPAIMETPMSMQYDLKNMAAAKKLRNGS